MCLGVYVCVITFNTYYMLLLFCLIDLILGQFWSSSMSSHLVQFTSTLNHLIKWWVHCTLLSLSDETPTTWTYALCPSWGQPPQIAYWATLEYKTSTFFLTLSHYAVLEPSFLILHIMSFQWIVGSSLNPYSAQIRNPKSYLLSHYALSSYSSQACHSCLLRSSIAQCLGQPCPDCALCNLSR